MIRTKIAVFRVSEPKKPWAKIRPRNRNPRTRNPRISAPKPIRCHPYFREPRVEHYDEEQAIAVQTEDVDRAKEERLITCICTAKYLEGLRIYYNYNIKGRSFAVGDLVLCKKQKTEGMHKLSSP